MTIKFETDLHVHSTLSDGLKNRDQIFSEFSNRGMKSFVFTEHNNILNQEETLISNQRYNIDFLFSGIELFAKDYENNSDVHILAYGNTLISRQFISWVREGTIKRDTFYRESISQAEKILGIKLPPYSDLLAAKPIDNHEFSYPYEPNRYIISAKVIAEHISLLTGISINEIMEKYIHLYKFTDTPDISLIIPKIKDAGGIAVLAHPLRGKKDDITKRNIIQRSIKLGIDGIEVRHPDHNQKDSDLLIEIAKNYKLLVTGGSDYHGKDKDVDNIGVYGVTQKETDILLEVISKR